MVSLLNLIYDNFVRLVRLGSIKLDRLIDRSVLLFHSFIIHGNRDGKSVVLHIRFFEHHHHIADSCRLFRFRDCEFRVISLA